LRADRVSYIIFDQFSFVFLFPDVYCTYLLLLLVT